MMKSRIFIFGVVLALVGCESGSIETPNPKGSPITFEISEATTDWPTRGSLIITDSLEKIGMFGYSHPSLALGGGWVNAGANPNADYFLNKIVIDYAPLGQVKRDWRYEGVVKYWPDSDKQLSFFAYAPYSDVNDNIVLTPNTTSPNGRPKITFITEIDVLKQVDLMWAANINQSAGPVSFDMKHALASVEFSVNLAGLSGRETEFKSLKVERVSLLYPLGRAILDLTNGAWTARTSPKIFDLLPNHGLVDSTFLFSDPKFATTHKLSGGATPQKDGYLMLIPQTLKNVLVEVKLSVIDINDQYLDGTDYFPVSEQEIVAGNKYNFVFKYGDYYDAANYHFTGNIKLKNLIHPPTP